MSKTRRNDFLCDGGVCPECAGVIVGWGAGWVCLDCRSCWRIALHPDADLSRPGFPLVPAADRASAARRRTTT
jgi:hypothetical protein